ncbi:hypothetical protein QN277_018770 [Acacia crassicarpa]|uniref:PLAT domain-containing protein n=1 Tax=Acacia crassicarpa TaxID=499986 RepID=A0AAE1MRW7_9FABA|nr:hypothetical protein QN277_018770 [Acacia crassicarpa]
MANSDECTYLIRIQTGQSWEAGTSAKISLKLESSDGTSFPIDDLRQWGIMESGHDYFSHGKVDIFRGTKPYLNVDKITLTSDDTGFKPGWYVDFVEISVYGHGLYKKMEFPVDTWLSSEPPYQLSVTRPAK